MPKFKIQFMFIIKAILKRIKNEIKEEILNDYTLKKELNNYDDILDNYFMKFSNEHMASGVNSFIKRNKIYGRWRHIFQNSLNDIMNEAIKNQDAILESIANEKWTNDYVDKVCEESIRRVFAEKYAEIASQQSYEIAQKLWNK